MTQADLFAPLTRHIADTSLEAWRRLGAELPAREIEVYLALCDYVTLTGHPDATGAELAAFARLDKTQTRPRLTGLERRGLVAKQATRASRAPGEGRCHPYRPVVPAAAVERGRQ